MRLPLLITALLFLAPLPAQERATSVKDVEIGLRFNTPSLHDGFYDVTVQVNQKVLNKSFMVGSMNLCFSFNILGLTEPNILQAYHFYSGEIFADTLGNLIHTYDMVFRREMDLAHIGVTHTQPYNACSYIGDMWLDVVRIRFRVINQNEDAALVWNSAQTWMQNFVNTDYVSKFVFENMSYPLPVELIFFRAVPMLSMIRLEWATLSETNNYGFKVQRAKDIPQGYETITFIQGHGTTTIRQDYAYTDINVPSGKWYYRLDQVDADGTRHPTAPIEVDVYGGVAPKRDSLEFMQNYPNPFNTATRFLFTLPGPGKVTITVYDIFGNSVETIHDGFLDTGKHLAYLDGSLIASGVYFAVMQYKQQSIKRKILFIK